MAKEIEYKYLAFTGHEFEYDRARIIDSAYLSIGDPEVRIARYRGEEGTYQLTVKSGAGLVREEIIVDLDDVKGAELFNLAPHKVSKTRYNVGRWELDIFLGRHLGLVTAEIEMASEDEPVPAPPRGIVLLADVTRAPEYKNKRLASASDAALDDLVECYGQALNTHIFP